MKMCTPATKQFPEKRLPRTLSGWIKAAVDDAQRLSRTPGFKLHMGYFNDVITSYSKTGVENGEVCAVCFGGAAIVGRGLVKPGYFMGATGGIATDVAYALDNVRQGDIAQAARELFHVDLIDWVPTYRSMERASELIARKYRRDNGLMRAPWSVYLEAAEIVKHKPKSR